MTAIVAVHALLCFLGIMVAMCSTLCSNYIKGICIMVFGITIIVLDAYSFLMFLELLKR